MGLLLVVTILVPAGCIIRELVLENTIHGEIPQEL